MVDKLILRDGAQELRNAIDAARATSLNTQIAKNADRMFLSCAKILSVFPNFGKHVTALQSVKIWLKLSLCGCSMLFVRRK